MVDGSDPGRTPAPAPGAPTYHWPFGEAVTPPPRRRPRSAGPGGIIAVAGLTALLVGAGAGFGASRLAADSSTAAPADPAVGADPVPLPPG